MANRRMFSLEIIDTDDFLAMPATARLLYYDLSMRADDEGFVGSAKKIMAFTGAAEDDMRVLVSRGYIIPFETGVVVIAHWHLNNSIRSDRAHETRYQREKAQLILEDKVYRLIAGAQEALNSNDPEALTTTCQPNDNQVTTNCQPDARVISIDKTSIDKREERARAREAYGQFGNVLLRPEEREALKSRYQNSHQLIDKVDRFLANTQRSYDNHLALILKIAVEDGWPRRPRSQWTEVAGMEKSIDDVTAQLAEKLGGKD